MEGGEGMRGNSAVRLTYDDLVQLPDDGLRHEIIDGEHFVTPSPSMRHQRVAGRLFTAFALHLREHPEVGEAFFAPLDVIFTQFDVVEPDLLFVAAFQQDILTEKHVRGAPAIVVEILSPGTRRVDEQIKRGLFERGGVGEYWVVDPDLNAITLFRRASDGSFPRVAVLTADAAETLTSPLLPGWSVPLTELFR